MGEGEAQRTQGLAEGTRCWRQGPVLTFRVVLASWAGPTEGLSWARTVTW